MLSGFIERCQFGFGRLQERLWVRPLIMCILSVTGVFIAKYADRIEIVYDLPSITLGSVESLLSVMASSMLTIAILAVGSMVAAYTSASSSATPRSFPLVIADDVSQNALSAFLGAFIFSLIGLLAVKNESYQDLGLFTLFVMTLLVFTLVILTFVRWVDRIARLGALGNTIAQVESATDKALSQRRLHPTLNAKALTPDTKIEGTPLYAQEIGYLQHLNVAHLQSLAVKKEAQVIVSALPGTFIYPSTPLAYISGVKDDEVTDFYPGFTLGRNRMYNDDPRFGLVVLAEIANKGIGSNSNDPGTAIEVLNTLVRLFSAWAKPLDNEERQEICHERVFVPTLKVVDMLDDAFTPIARSGVNKLEVMIRLQKSFAALADLEHPELSQAAQRQARLALSRAEKAMAQPEDIEVLRRIVEK